MKTTTTAPIHSLLLLALFCVNVSVSAFTVKSQPSATATAASSSRLFASWEYDTATGRRGVGIGRPDRYLNSRIDRYERGAAEGRYYDNGAAAPPVIVQGGSLKTWSFPSLAVERVQVVLSTEGRPLDADIELWQGPDNTPHKMRVYSEDGGMRPISAVIPTPRGPNTVAIRNIGQLEFPMDAYVVGDTVMDVDRQMSNGPLLRVPTTPDDMTTPARTIQGGALRTFPFESAVQSVQILLQTDGRPLRARLELLQGPNNNKQVLEVYTEDGLDRPMFVVMETPGSGNVVRVVNSATVEFPMTAWVEPYVIDAQAAAYQDSYGNGVNSPGEAILGGDFGTGRSMSNRRSLAW